MKRIAVFASGSGSNFQSIVDENQVAYEVVLLVCDQPKAKVIERGNKADIPTCVFQPKSYVKKEVFEKEIIQQLFAYQVDFIVLAGYMRLIGPTILSAYEGKIVNIHPSLLPAFPGKDAIGQALDKNVKVTGVTVHFVDEGMDTGPIIAQEPIYVHQEDSRVTLQQKIHEIEHHLYPKVIQDLCLSSEKESV
ncbi:phosphoribosylglycinamide formyltransferase-1 [Salinibacillus kushneri]|uniref:Phosphoribosylglycinamide formyltransferase n=1 Tax=Salinibacillus kushneri TaxID=237682 RepID=A0A1I0IWI3_9BACI|nr:phosphoribosylglycinamide formyltransferase [Salinibacillus kushneri]SEU01733.1 phosphoribosylglycinamide formyltransferase-1 [Salinibacillus kushneri]